MKVSLVTRTAGIAAVAAIGLAACGSSSSGGSGGTGGGGASLTGSGSTFQANIQQEWTAKFTNAKVSYNAIGTGSGQQQFVDGSVNFAGEDVVLPADQKSAAEATCNGPTVQIPVTAGGVAIIYNLPGVKTLKLDADTTAKIFQGDITKWNDPAIAALNPGVSLPSTAITVYHRADGSGTTAVTSAWLDSQAKGVWKLGAGQELNWPQGTQGAQGSSGVTQGVQQTAGGITYAEQSYVKAPLKAAVVKNAKGKFVALNADTVSSSVGTGYKSQGADGGVMDFTAMSGYPVSTVSFILACQKYSDSATANALKAFLTYAVTDGQSYAAQIDYAPLASNVVSTDQQLIASIS